MVRGLHAIRRFSSKSSAAASNRFLGFADRIRAGTHPKVAYETMDRYLENGGRFLNVTAGYEEPTAEAVFMHVARDLIDRDDLTVCAAYPMPPDFPKPGVTPGEWTNQKLSCQQWLEKITPTIPGQLDVVMIDADLIKSRGQATDEVYSKLAELFSELETQVTAGVIKSFGVSSQDFGRPSSHPEHLNLEKLLSSAPGGFKHISSVFNLLQGGVGFELNCARNTKTTAQMAKEAGLSVFGYSSFDSRDMEGQELRLASFPRHADKDLQKELKDAFNTAIQFEKMFPEMIKDLEVPPEDTVYPHEMAWAQILAGNQHQIDNFVRWEEIRYGRVEPAYEDAIRRMGHVSKLQGFAYKHRMVMNTLFNTLTFCAEHTASFHSQKIEKCVDELEPRLAELPTLQEKAAKVVWDSQVVDRILTDQCTLFHQVAQAPFQLTPDEALNILQKCSRIFPPFTPLQLGSDSKA